jgi:LmbE family N-acetylglucosaminyl deacetylase
MAKASDEGHRVVLVVATRGEHGEVAEGFLDEGEALWQRRVEETVACAEILGVARVEFLGYVDSGMVGTPENDLPESFWQADVGEAAARLAAILTEEGADVLTVYDENGGYGHPDHIQVHRVGLRAAELAGTPRVFEATMNREFLLQRIEEAAASMPDEVPEGEMPSTEEIAELGSAEADITHGVDVAAFTEAKRASMRCHASQIPPDSFFLSMPEEIFQGSFGIEWYIEHGTPRAEGAPFVDSLFG